MTTLVTGAAGFIGRHLLPRLAGAIPLTREQADLSRALPALPPADTIIHCAAELDDAAWMRAVNVEGTARLLASARSMGIQKFTYLSTGGIGVTGLYAETKREGEELVLQSGMNVRVVRLFFAYGPGQGARRLVPRLVARVRSGWPVTIDPRGGPFLSLTYIDDAVEGILRETGSGIVEVGGAAVAMREIAHCIGRAVGRDPRFEVSDTNATDFVTASSELRQATSLEAGIHATIGGIMIMNGDQGHK